ncbi:tigger transposable element-derived protein 4-like [Ctenocephalides felis]|uniref:tigger transposable element-derived protein 4-like n=1 Tax=Ctenocephalides felis TaxID=7515 RepID=UPI000E6E32F9|nr:tigger transposable element-derived protein 4-like [Ctenocephalides felis]
MASRHRKAFTIEEKCRIIRRLENGESNSSLAKELGVGHSTISMIFKNKNIVEQSFNSNVLKPKRLRKSRQENIDQALIQWFKITRGKGIPVSGPMLQEKANFFAARFNNVDFNCTASWISRFKVRHNIVAGKIVGESLSGDENSTTNWLTSVWPNLRKQFSDDDIFNADETGLFYKLMPERTLKFKGENCSGGKLSKDRITLMVAANMSGTEKKKLLIIGKSQKPRCFKSIKSLPVDYANNRKAWMTSEIFEKWIRDWDRDLVKKNRKILLLVDNCPAHPNIADLNSITLAFFPPNTTSILQPMDQGIIRSLKTNFRKNLVLKMILCVDDNEDLSSKITVLDAILMVNDAWNKLQQNTIHNCFRHSGLNKSHDDSPFQISENEFVEEDVPLSLLLRNRNIDLATTPEMWEEYVDIDNTLITCEELTDENIIQNINDNELFGSDEEKEVDDKLPTAEEALKAAELLSKFVSSNIENENVTNAMSFVHNSVRDCFCNKMKKKIQTKITDFLH